MFLVVMILLFVIALVLSLSTWRKYKEIIYQNEMKSIYIEMEDAIVKNSLVIDKNLKSFLKAHKEIVVNPEIADIKVLNALMHLSHKYNKNKEVVKSEIPLCLIPLANNFSTLFAKTIRLSMLKWDNLSVCFYCSIVFLLEFFFHKGDVALTFLKKKIDLDLVLDIKSPVNYS